MPVCPTRPGVDEKVNEGLEEGGEKDGDEEGAGVAQVARAPGADTQAGKARTLFCSAMP